MIKKSRIFSAIIAVLMIAMAAVPCGVAAAEADQGIKAGDKVFFGRYEQDNDLENGREAIEWIVLEVQDGKALMTTRYGLDGYYYYNEETESMTWEKSTVRAWLNGEFLSGSFNETEQAVILETEVDNSSAQAFDGWPTHDGGNNTKDKVFLLSYAEAYKYFHISLFDTHNVKARLAPTVYSTHHAWVSDTNRTEDEELASFWMLRSPGYTPYSCSVVVSTGALYYRNVFSNDGLVRPALWVDLAAIGY